MFAQFFKRTDYYDKYMQLYAMRQAIANLQMEDNKTDMLNPMRTHEMYNNVIAFENILLKRPDVITPYDLIDINGDVNAGIYNKGFRKTQVNVKRAKNFIPPAAYQVPQAVYSLFDTYHNIWVNLPIYEKEARFHIELVRIQPFEDGNKRSARILTNYNLCHQNKAPAVISGIETDKYFGFIDDYDVDGMATLLREKSEEEFEIMLDLYRSTRGDSLSDDPILTAKEEDIKTMIIAKRIIEDIGKTK